MSYFDDLGVPSTASDAEIAAAYHRLARQLHPDAHPEASPDEHAVYEAKMTRINIAYEAIKTADRRRDHRYAQPSYTQEPTQTNRSARGAPSARCAMCGATPGEPFRYPSGRSSPTNLWLCRHCAQTLTLTMTRPLNTAALARQVRVGLSLVVLLVGAVVLIGRSVDLASTTGANPNNFKVPFPTHTTPTSVATTALDPWVVYDCVTARPYRDPIDCTQPHQGVITARVTTSNFCPPGTDHYRQIPSTKQIACIDES